MEIINWDDTIILVYRYLKLKGSEDYKYYLGHVFDGYGSLDIDVLLDIYNDLPEYSIRNEPTQELIGPFNNVDDIQKLSFLLCQKLERSKILIYSITDYNRILENSNDIYNIRKNLLAGGEKISNPDFKEKKQGIISKIFY